MHPGIPPEGERIPWPPERLAAALARVRHLSDQAGLPIGDRTHWYHSVPAHEAAEWAHEHYPAEEEEFRRAIFRAYFAGGQNIGDPEVLVALAEARGLDGSGLRSALADRRYLPDVTAQFEAARASGVDGVPTAVAGGYAVVGAQPYAVFQQLMAAVGETPHPA